MQIFIAGGTGFIGGALCKYFVSRGDKVTVLTHRSRSLHSFPGVTLTSDVTTLTKTPFDVIINLAGEPLHKHRWTTSFKKKLCDSRVTTTKKIVDALSHSPHKPKAFLSGSAIGFYGNDEDISFTEQSSVSVIDFPHVLCKQWEEAAYTLSTHGTRVCTLRTGIVLGHNSITGALAGALAQMVTPFRFGLGAQLGNGKQWMSWIHLEDWIGILDLIIKNSDIKGPVNLTAPHPVTNAVFTRTLAQTLHRPCFFTIPAPIVRLMFGQMGKDLLLLGQKVLPAKASTHGYTFKYPELSSALKDIFKP